MTHEHRAAPGLTSHPNKPPGCSQYLPVSLSPSQCAKLAGPVPKLHSWEAECTIAAPSGRSPCPTCSLSQKSLSKWLPRGIFPCGNGHAGSGTVSQGGDSIWSRMELLKTCVLIQCFSSAFSPPAGCFSASAGFQGKLSKKGRAWLLMAPYIAVRDIWSRLFWFDSS